MLPCRSETVVDGTSIILAPDGVLHVGESVTTLTPTTETTNASGHPIVVASQTVTPYAGGFVFNVSTALPGGSGFVAGRTDVSLAPNGVLHIWGQGHACERHR